jgi:hypothetical protein
MYKCRYCEREFQRENTLSVHVCEPKRRYQEEKEVGVQLGLQSYLRFYEISQGSARLKTFDDFAKSPYYRAFVKFGRYCVALKVINVNQFIEWLLKNNKKIDHWCRDSMYSEYLMHYIRFESVSDALARAMEFGISWSEENDYPAQDCLRYGNANTITYAISVGRISPWVIYNCESGQKFLDEINQEQVAIIWPYIDADFWQRKFRDFPADQEYARDILKKAGW